MVPSVLSSVATASFTDCVYLQAKVWVQALADGDISTWQLVPWESLIEDKASNIKKRLRNSSILDQKDPSLSRIVAAEPLAALANDAGSITNPFISTVADLDEEQLVSASLISTRMCVHGCLPASLCVQWGDYTSVAEHMMLLDGGVDGLHQARAALGFRACG
eukprot:GHVU01117353.1.p2 GENE.GHVU01117353.1~~GHVU01117353.1.p2  ORF type:complete len:163 (-),score=9.48 GHVU01117353.1:2847-3335(-)